MKRSFILALATTALFGFTNQQTGVLTNDAARGTANVITGDTLKEYLTYIASDELQGRDTPSPGLDKAADYIAKHLKEWGAKPGGDNGTYFQNITLERNSYDRVASTVTVGDTAFAMDKDFLVFGGSSTRISGTVFVITQKAEFYDVRGKIAVLGPKLGGEEDLLIKSGATAVLKASDYSGTSWTSFVDGVRQFAGGFRPGSPTPATAEAGPKIPPRVTISGDAYKQILGMVDSKAQITIVASKETATTRNVVAIAEGSDPKLKAEYVAVGAHYDHVGMNPNLPGDKIYNGADDDGSGTVSVMNIAKAFLTSTNRPKRSILFVWHCGEEKGLWGSDYYNSHLTVPKGSIVAQLNIDMIGRSRKAGDTNPRNNSLTGPNAVYVIGTTMMSTRLGEIVHGVNGKYLALEYDKKYDDPKDPNRFFYRSDHYNYAKNGIPICFWFDGEHEDYHQVSDEVSKIDFSKMEKIARTVYLTGVTVANEPVRPMVDKALGR
jgi:hypothetical protein